MQVNVIIGAGVLLSLTNSYRGKEIIMIKIPNVLKVNYIVA